MIGYDKRGVVFALTEGSELLVHDGPSEGPLWCKTLDGKIVGVAASSERVVAITEAGTVTAFSARAGDVMRTVKLDGKVRVAVADAAAERVVAVTEDKIVAVAGDAVTTLADHTAKAIAMRADGAVLVATETDELILLAGGARTASTYDGVAITSLAHHPAGFWVLGLPAKLMRWDGSAAPAHITNLPKDTRLADVACSDRCIAATLDRNTVVVLAWPSKETLGSLDYVDKTVEGIDLGPWPWLGVSLSLGDGNKFNLETADLNRSDTHPGRTHHRWLVSVSGGGKAAPPTPAPRASAPAPVGSNSSSGSKLGLIAILLAVVAAAIYFAVH